mgnify:CR=1 FL=1
MAISTNKFHTLRQSENKKSHASPIKFTCLEKIRAMRDDDITCIGTNWHRGPSQSVDCRLLVNLPKQAREMHAKQASSGGGELGNLVAERGNGLCRDMTVRGKEEGSRTSGEDTWTAERREKLMSTGTGGDCRVVGQ